MTRAEHRTTTRNLEDTMIEIHIGPLYYAPIQERFFQVRAQNEGSCTCSGFCTYYADASATVCEQELSDAFIDACEMIVAIDQSPHAHFDGTGWKVKP